MTLRLTLLAVVAASAAAQPAPDIVGTWELESAENSPVEDDLVFARLTITDETIGGLFVFLDPDDGELTGRRTRGLYRVSDGQLIVRENNGVTVVDAVRDGDRLTVRDLETGVVLRLRQADAALAVDPDLLGAWVNTRDGGTLALRFRPDGTVESGAGDDPETDEWSAAGPYLVIGRTPARYAVTRDADGGRQLAMETDGETTVLRYVSD